MNLEKWPKEKQLLSLLRFKQKELEVASFKRLQVKSRVEERVAFAQEQHYLFFCFDEKTACLVAILLEELKNIQK